MRLICEFFGERKKFKGQEYLTFPKQGNIDDMDKLVSAKTGYRAKYIYEINRIVKENPKILDEIEQMNYIDSKKKLMEFPGIGSKVADCICLFALGHEDAFPIDTWVKQVIEKLYLKRETKNMKEIEQFIEKKFSGHRGLKQQYLFHYMRNEK